MKRKEGYYWIILHDGAEWEVAYYDESGWYSIWEGSLFQDDELKEIDDKTGKLNRKQ